MNETVPITIDDRAPEIRLEKRRLRRRLRRRERGEPAIPPAPIDDSAWGPMKTLRDDVATQPKGSWVYGILTWPVRRRTWRPGRKSK